MKIVIASDIHNNITNLKKVLDYCAKNEIKTIICCGDLGGMETLDFLNDNFSGEIYFTFGNMDDEHLRNYELVQNYKKTRIFEDFGEIEIDGKKIGLVHYPWEAEKLAGSGKYNYVFYGHTHKPWTEKIGKCEMLNPGNVAGEIYPPTFATWETTTGKFDLIRIHDLK